MSIPLKLRWFDDHVVGETVEFGDHLVTADEIIDFGRRYDTQPFHVDPEAALQSSFGGLVASGWMTASVLMRLMCDHYIAPASAMGSPGVDNLRWLRPVRPGDRLRARVTVVHARRSQSKPDRGSILLHQELLNQSGETVMAVDGWAILRCRPA